ncbi:MAG: hypothetical protein RBR02_10160 [Desulfuromonadaceae bacterium]|nr:hypothetical protein [Desulfuromonadaceae bacterium]
MRNYYIIKWSTKNVVGLGFTNGVEVFRTRKDLNRYLKETNLKNDVYGFEVKEITAEDLNELIWYPKNQDKSINKDYDLPVQFH